MVSPRAPQRVSVQALVPLRAHPFLSLVFLECPAVSLELTFPVTAVTDHLCIKVRRGIFLPVLLLVLALALLPLTFALALVDGADIHRCRACQCATAMMMLLISSHKRIRHA